MSASRTTSLRKLISLLVHYGDRRGRSLQCLNRWQAAFCKWNAQRLGIDERESRARYAESWQLFEGGHGRSAFRAHIEKTHDLLSVFCNDSTNEVYEAYRMHEMFHFLRMLTHPAPIWSGRDVIAADLSKFADEITIVDFGCGLAQRSITLSEYLTNSGCEVRLFLYDIPTIRLEFVEWFCTTLALNFVIVKCDQSQPVPDFPSCHTIIATEVFEHLHDPLPVFDAMDEALIGGGFLLTNVKDHKSEFMHVSPVLEPIRNRLEALSYSEISPKILYQKANVNSAARIDSEHETSVRKHGFALASAEAFS